MTKMQRRIYWTVAALVVVPLAVGTGAAFAQQPQQRQLSVSEALAAMKAVEGQRDYAQQQATNANMSAQRLGDDMSAEINRLKAELAAMVKTCGEPCKPPKADAK